MSLMPASASRKRRLGSDARAAWRSDTFAMGLSLVGSPLERSSTWSLGARDPSSAAMKARTSSKGRSGLQKAQAEDVRAAAKETTKLRQRAGSCHRARARRRAFIFTRRVVVVVGGGRVRVVVLVAGFGSFSFGLGSFGFGFASRHELEPWHGELVGTGVRFSLGPRRGFVVAGVTPRVQLVSGEDVSHRDSARVGPPVLGVRAASEFGVSAHVRVQVAHEGHSVLQLLQWRACGGEESHRGEFFQRSCAAHAPRGFARAEQRPRLRGSHRRAGEHRLEDLPGIHRSVYRRLPVCCRRATSSGKCASVEPGLLMLLFCSFVVKSHSPENFANFACRCWTIDILFSLLLIHTHGDALGRWGTRSGLRACPPRAAVVRVIRAAASQVVVVVASRIPRTRRKKKLTACEKG
jgi:hypothetical protein